ncbi:hypothetical protein AYM02_02285 [Coxiella burnetii]|nr:hypothetical protein AUR58_02610 [Coxiella burnetii]AML55656.1 hypothetical protein AYM38_02255 [Coxiella burnetii]ATN68175.1 hypothetical protein AYM00_02340 [Coxiella burnetii]ATN70103.1 hypothetical protein AYM02_02285 [Coxiella burnetii]AZV74805.1 hypothetical protein D6219_02505 [Coxiella burnetii]
MLAHYDAVFKGWVHFIGLLDINCWRLGAERAGLIWFAASQSPIVIPNVISLIFTGGNIY